MKEVKLANIENLNKRELKRAIQDCFDYAPDASPVDRLAILQEAQFYRTELDRRHDSWISIRDFVLEIVVIGLIGWEVHMGYRQAADQATQFSQQQQIFENLEKSSKATAEALTSLQGTTETMNGAIQKELGLFYDVNVLVTLNNSSKRLTFANEGRTSITLWGTKVADEKTIIDSEPRTVAPGTGYSLDVAKTYDSIVQRFPIGSSGLTPFEVYLKNQRNEEFVMHSYFSMTWENDKPMLRMQIRSIFPEGWPR